MLFSMFTQPSTLPPVVRSCLARNSGSTINTLQRPPYLKLFFTRGPKPDYAVVVKEKGSDRNRVLVCTHDGKQIILGSKSDKRPFSDMVNDEYLSSNWRVCSKRDVRALRKYYSDVPAPANEALCLLWEDGEGLIYSDGHRFLWKSLKP